MSSRTPAPGAKFVSGEIVDAKIRLIRSDGSSGVTPGVLVVRGTLTDNEDGFSFNLTFPE